FSNSIFPTATFNIGPDVVTDDHLDMLTNRHGMCGVTFNHKKGGHIHLNELKAVIEFPSGSSMLILSIACEHGNTRIQKGETRYSMTQYAAGSLFRWAAYGYQSSKSLLAQKGGRVAETGPGVRAEWALGLLSKADELEADRKDVFGF
ncbi:hypothetical protein B0H14DRAFT_2351431, partial [Mycena olivaceomarginata]